MNTCSFKQERDRRTGEGWDMAEGEGRGGKEMKGRRREKGGRKASKNIRTRNCQNLV